MSENFESQKKALLARYADISPEERKELKQCLRRKNPLLYRKAEHLKHEMIRLESKRCSLSSAGEEAELLKVEEKILATKAEFFELLAKVKKNRK